MNKKITTINLIYSHFKKDWSLNGLDIPNYLGEYLSNLGCCYLVTDNQIGKVYELTYKTNGFFENWFDARQRIIDVAQELMGIQGGIGMVIIKARNKGADRQECESMKKTYWERLPLFQKVAYQLLLPLFPVRILRSHYHESYLAEQPVMI